MSISVAVYCDRSGLLTARQDCVIDDEPIDLASLLKLVDQKLGTNLISREVPSHSIYKFIIVINGKLVGDLQATTTIDYTGIVVAAGSEIKIMPYPLIGG